jgi:hypothetical protein
MAEFLLLAGLPLLVGLATGAIVPKQGRLNIAAIVIAPVVSCVVVCIVLFAWDVFYQYSHPNPDRPFRVPIVVRSLMATVLHAGGVLLAGAIPAIAGSAFVQWLKAVPKP